MADRMIGTYTGTQPGPMIICLGGVHGNEPAGIRAIEEVMRLLQLEPSVNPGFSFSGTIIGLRGNLRAITARKRFIDTDLNRIFFREDVNILMQTDPLERSIEQNEMLELVSYIESAIQLHQPTITLILDLHTTTANGSGFSIAQDDEMSLMLAKGMHIPVILGINQGLKGTTLDFFNRPEEDLHCIVIEAGQHDDPESIQRSLSTIINCMRSIGCVLPRDVDHHHDVRLMELGAGLPKVTRLIHHYKIQPKEIFVMREGYKNFDRIAKGEVLAENESGPIHSTCEGLILMPKYQPQGDDGFFIVEAVE